MQKHRLPWIARKSPWWIRRLYWHYRIMIDGYYELNNRASVESEMWQCVSGKKPMPDKEQLRQWALKLGVPEHFKK